jgi:hypothetical protein
LVWFGKWIQQEVWPEEAGGCKKEGNSRRRYFSPSLSLSGEFPTKKNSAEDGIDGRNNYIMFRGAKKEANSCNAVPNHSAEEKTTQNKPRQPKISKTYHIFTI